MKTLTFLSSRPLSGGLPRELPIALDKAPHVLIVGASGSGKTVASMLLTAKIGRHIPESKVWICDFKGDDSFTFLRGKEGARYFSYTDCVRGVEDFFDVLQTRLAGNPDRNFRLLWVDELAAMILNLPKKEAERVKEMLSTILLMGRSMGCQLLTTVQRASAELFAHGARDNYGVCLALGNLSKEGALMLGFERDEFLPVTNIGGGHLLINGTQQTPVQVPVIGPRGLAAMENDIFRATTR